MQRYTHNPRALQADKQKTEQKHTFNAESRKKRIVTTIRMEALVCI